jgi:TolB protein
MLLLLLIAASGCDVTNVVTDNEPPKDTTDPNPGPFRVDQTPAWSPDGRYVAYHHDAERTDDTTDVSGLYVVDLETDATHLVVEGPARSPDWRPDGERIAFTTDNIYTIRPDGSDLRQVTEFGDSYFPAWSPNGARLAFDTSYRDENGAHVVWLIDPDGSNLEDISQHGVGEWRDPDWSPGGSEIVHLRFLDGVFGEEVFVMDSTGSKATRLTHNERNDRYPTWSPDGQWIAWSPLNENDFELWVMRADGTDKRKLADGGSFPAWSPNSERIVFSKPAQGSDLTALWTIHRDGTDLQQITDPSRNPLN